MAATNTNRAKIAKPEAEGVGATELEVAKCLKELESNPQCEIQSELAYIKIAGAIELVVNGDETKKVIAISVPYRVYTDHVRKIQARLISELEKKLRKHVVVFAKRRIIGSKNIRRFGMKVRPHSRTLTAVHEALLEDVVGPTEIVGKRLRVRVDGSKVHKIFLDPKDKNKENIEEKLDAFAEVYKRLTSKIAVFSFES